MLMNSSVAHKNVLQAHKSMQQFFGCGLGKKRVVGGAAAEMMLRAGHSQNAKCGA